MDHATLRATMELKPEYRAIGLDARHTNCCITYAAIWAGPASAT